MGIDARGLKKRDPPGPTRRHKDQHGSAVKITCCDDSVIAWFSMVIYYILWGPNPSCTKHHDHDWLPLKQITFLHEMLRRNLY